MEEKRCTKCGNVKPIGSFGQRKGKTYHYSWCKGCVLEHHHEVHKFSPRYKYSRYKAGAKRRHIPFDLTFEQFVSFWQLHCLYCGNAISTAGLDRVDACSSYCLANCVPCCTTCNTMKMSDDIETWTSHMKQGLIHLGIVSGQAQYRKTLFPDPTEGDETRSTVANPDSEKRICPYCRDTKFLDEFCRHSSGHWKSMCKTCKSGYDRSYKQKPQRRYASYQEEAVKDGREFLLTFEDFMGLWQKPCAYCGNAITTIGIDRKDNSVGYRIDNCTPCCTRCNSMKLDQGFEEWASHMKQILEHLGIIPS